MLELCGSSCVSNTFIECLLSPIVREHLYTRRRQNYRLHNFMHQMCNSIAIALSMYAVSNRNHNNIKTVPRCSWYFQWKFC
jgi:hypothetical protein